MFESGSTSESTVVFRPFRSIQWPGVCMGCLSDSPTERLTLDVSPAAGEPLFCEIPVCTLCRNRLFSSDMDRLAGVIESAVVQTSVLVREFRSGCVVLKFSNPRYAALFREANQGLVFGSVDQCLAAPKPQRRPEEISRPEPPQPEKRESTFSVAQRETDPDHVLQRALREPVKPADAKKYDPVHVSPSVFRQPLREEKKDGQEDEPKTWQKCPQCGSRMSTSDWLCRNCGYTDWGAMIVTIVLGLGLLAASIFGAPEIRSVFWRFVVRWLCGPAGVLFLAVALTEFVKILSFRPRR